MVSDWQKQKIIQEFLIPEELKDDIAYCQKSLRDCVKVHQVGFLLLLLQLQLLPPSCPPCVPCVRVCACVWKACSTKRFINYINPVPINWGLSIPM